MVCAAGRAIPFTLLERELRIDIPTAAAALAGGVSHFVPGILYGSFRK